MTDVIVKRANGTLDVGLLCDDPSLTKQSESAACDINKIMAKYEKSQLITHLNENEAFYADVSQVPDYQGALKIVRDADDMFMSLPADVRSRFDNDPQEYLSFVSNPANKPELIKMGILPPDKAVTGAPAPGIVVPPVVEGA